jgi:hypothetical protein
MPTCAIAIRVDGVAAIAVSAAVIRVLRFIMAGLHHCVFKPGGYSATADRPLLNKPLWPD